MKQQFKEGDLIEWQPRRVERTSREINTRQGIIISHKEMTSHLHNPGRKGVTSGIMLEVLFEGSEIEWVSANQCHIVSETDE